MSERWFSEAMQDPDVNVPALSILQQYVNGTHVLPAQTAAEQILAADPDPGYMLVHAASELPAAHNQLVDIVAAAKELGPNSIAGLYIELRERWNRELLPPPPPASSPPSLFSPVLIASPSRFRPRCLKHLPIRRPHRVDKHQRLGRTSPSPLTRRIVPTLRLLHDA